MIMVSSYSNVELWPLFVLIVGGQIMNSLKRPVNSFSRESSSTANSCTREPVEREGTSMLSSTSRRRYEEERSTTLDCVDRIQKLNVGKACPESFDDDCIYIEHDVKQRKNRLGNNNPGSIINLDDQFDVVVEQYEVAAEKVESDASLLHTRKGFTKCSEEVEKILDDNRFRLVTCSFAFEWIFLRETVAHRLHRVHEESKCFRNFQVIYYTALRVSNVVL